MKIFLKAFLVAVPAAILFLSAPAYPHGGEKSDDQHSAPKLVAPVMEESAHGGENHHAPDTVEPTMGEQGDNHSTRQRLKKYVAEDLHRAALNKAKAEASERKAMEETEKLKYRTAVAVFGIFILIIGLVLRYAPGRGRR